MNLLYGFGPRTLKLGRIEITQYALDTAMHGAIDIKIFDFGYLCIKPPTRSFGAWWPWYIYFSRDATPTSATWRVGKRFFRRCV